MSKQFRAMMEEAAEMEDWRPSQLASTVGVAMLIIALGCGGGSCAERNEKTDDQSAKAESGEREDSESSERPASGEEESSSPGPFARPPLVHLEWSDFADVKLLVRVPPGDDGDRRTPSTLNPGPGGGEYEFGGNRGCSWSSCNRDGAPYREWVAWPADAEPRSGTYEVAIAVENKQPYESGGAAPESVSYTVELYDAKTWSEAKKQEPIHTWTGSIESTGGSSTTEVGMFEVE